MLGDSIFGTWNKKNIEKWEDIRANGKWKFTLKYGVAIYGGVVFFLMMFGLNSIFNYESPFTYWFVVAVNILGALLGGWWYGHYMWQGTEKSYNEFISKTRSPPNE
ncbi:hypothetical protein EYS14_09275 [Alteromonadaceae bacterium M269]|nr:hypothetical protein EYS14_09275 [Alteromonadaceae bacterium M269]